MAITIDELKKAIPKGTSHKVTDKIMSLINNIENDTGMDQNIMEDKLLSSTHLLSTGRFTLEAYINAVKYVNLKQHMSNIDAWSLVFKDKFNQLEAEGKQIDNRVAMYNKTQLVTSLTEMLIIPAYLQYNNVYHEMIERQANLARGIGANSFPDGDTGEMKSEYVSPKIQQEAGAKLIDILSLPKDNSVELKIGMSDEAKSTTESLVEQLKAIASQQKSQYQAGKSVEDIQQLGLVIDVEPE